mmetsp:Transcript_30820/g.97177  ORF Transcript_30820/g.97177 Transcript_30820/m.97177 type:complete len:204 (+) Transcript_30820:485-1096(+)
MARGARPEVRHLGVAPRPGGGERAGVRHARRHVSHRRDVWRACAKVPAPVPPAPLRDASGFRGFVPPPLSAHAPAAGRGVRLAQVSARRVVGGPLRRLGARLRLLAARAARLGALLDRGPGQASPPHDLCRRRAPRRQLWPRGAVVVGGGPRVLADGAAARLLGGVLLRRLPPLLRGGGGGRFTRRTAGGRGQRRRHAHDRPS